MTPTASALTVPSRRDALALIGAALALGACSPFGPSEIASTTVNGRTIRVFARGSASRSSSVEQSGQTTRLTLGNNQVVIVNPDGRVSVNGTETAHGPFTELSITIGDGDRIEVKVVK